ncbi:MAG: hypothetical protein E7231_05535 [Cellulosilyticum sp.]|nr:hypothetical protein [Cellulosilyticum sp.]
MDNNFQGLPQLNLNPFTAQYNLSAVNATSLAFQITPSVDIIPGFRSNNTPISWQLSVDQHTLRFYINEQLTATGAIQYELSLVGILYYNVAFLGVEPINPVVDSNLPIAFANNGSYKIDQVVGTFNSIAEIQNVVLSNFSITASLDQLYIIDSEGNRIVYDPTNPLPFYNALSGNENVTIYAVQTIIITFSEQPIS